LGKVLSRIHLVDDVERVPGKPITPVLIEDPKDSLTLVDAGEAGTLESFRKYLNGNGFSLEQVKRIIITHVHPDHIGSLKALLQETGAKAYSHWAEAPYIAQKPPYDGPPKIDYSKIEPVEVDVELSDGDSIPVLGGIEVIHTPGHTPRHICLYSKRSKTLIVGALFFNAGQLELCTPDVTLHPPTAAISAKRVAELEFDNLLLYHGPSLFGDARAKVRALIGRL
jgi:glyoxylase-like metal-dependent hydrolase (beta-lactamase superfamily II)